MSEFAQGLLKRAASMMSERQVHEPTWRECFLLTDPVRASGFDGTDMNATQIAAAVAKIFDSTGTDAKRILGASIQAGMTPANSLWFKMSVNGQSDEEGRWLDESSEVLWENIHNANFDSEASDCLDDCMGAGWFALFVDEADEGGFNFEHWPLAGVYCGASKPGGKIDTIARPFKLTAEQAVSAYSKRGDTLPPEIVEAAKTKPEQKYGFWWFIYPRTLSVQGAKMARNLPIASVTVSELGKQEVRVSGFHEMPVIVPRWRKIPNSVYAVGPVLDALPDLRTLNELCKLELANADLALSGMWIAEDDGVLNPRTVKVGPRKVIVANSTDSMKPLTPGVNFQIAWTMKDKLQAAIRKILLADQLQPQDGPQMTATEVHVRVDLIRQLLGPIYGRLQAEYLQPLIERCFGLAYRAGVFSEPPESLAGRDFSIRYVSPLARAQKLEEVSAIERLYADAGTALQATQDASIMDNIDHDVAIRTLSKDLGAPQSIMRTADQVMALRQQRAQAQQAQAQQQQDMETRASIQQAQGAAAAKAAPSPVAQLMGVPQPMQAAAA